MVSSMFTQSQQTHVICQCGVDTVLAHKGVIAGHLLFNK